MHSAAHAATPIAAIPYAFCINGEPDIDSHSPMPNCPYGPSTKAAAIEVIDEAHEAGMQVMLKPQLFSDGGWIGHLDFPTAAEWDTFEMKYTNFIIEWAQIAEDKGVSLFCVGTELKIFVEERPAYWSNLIREVREIYTGPLTYAANWDDYMDVPFWNDLDIVGVDAYFPLIKDKTPSVADLKAAWQPYAGALVAFQAQYQKPIAFTEFGYMSVDSCGYNTWELEQKKDIMDINEQAQANALQALLETYLVYNWWVGGFQWKWYADPLSALCDGDVTKDYTPKDKLSSEVLKAMYE